MSGGWLSRLKSGLAKSSSRLVDGIAGVFTRRRLDAEAIEELEDVLITADLGPATAARPSRGALLYQRYFGISGIFFEEKILASQCVTVVLQATFKLPKLAAVAVLAGEGARGRTGDCCSR